MCSSATKIRKCQHFLANIFFSIMSHKRTHCLVKGEYKSSTSIFALNDQWPLTTPTQKSEKANKTVHCKSFREDKVWILLIGDLKVKVSKSLLQIISDIMHPLFVYPSFHTLWAGTMHALSQWADKPSSPLRWVGQLASWRWVLTGHQTACQIARWV